jgi:hypothetical protein
MATLPPEPSFTAPFAPPESLLIHRTVAGRDLEQARTAAAVVRDEMRADGMALVARSSRDTARGVVIDLVFARRL